MKHAVFWISFVLMLFAGSMGIQAVMVYHALNDPSFAVEPDYEWKADNWDRLRRERAASEALGWSVDLRTTPDVPGTVRVELSLADREGTPIDRADVNVDAFHNARAAQVIEARLVALGDGRYESRMGLRRSGLWEFRLAIVRGDERWSGSLRRSVISVPVSTESGP